MKKLYLALGVVVAFIGVGAVACGSLSDAGMTVASGGAAAVAAWIVLAGAGAFLGSRTQRPWIPESQ